MLGIRSPAAVVLLLALFLSSIGVPVILAETETDLGADCEWKYQCEWLLQKEPFICGRWAPEAEKICPPSTTTTPRQAEEDVGSFSPFHMIKAPCLAPYISDRHGKCRLAFVG